MRYYIKSKLFKIKEDFWVKNDKGEDYYFIDKEFFSFGLQFRVIENNNEIYRVREKLLKFMPSYEIYDNNNSIIGTVKKQFTFFKDSIFVESNYGDFEIEGDFWHYSYRSIIMEELLQLLIKKFYHLQIIIMLISIMKIMLLL